ncbi:MAG: hypothetical protein N2690_01265 [Rhodocyclaceae bacterium]|nr:hypothetical protein [Rhodocyclaceae bacterium]
MALPHTIDDTPCRQSAHTYTLSIPPAPQHTHEPLGLLIERAGARVTILVDKQPILHSCSVRLHQYCAAFAAPRLISLAPGTGSVELLIQPQGPQRNGLARAWVGPLAEAHRAHEHLLFWYWTAPIAIAASAAALSLLAAGILMSIPSRDIALVAIVAFAFALRSWLLAAGELPVHASLVQLIQYLLLAVQASGYILLANSMLGTQLRSIDRIATAAGIIASLLFLLAIASHHYTLIRIAAAILLLAAAASLVLAARRLLRSPRWPQRVRIVLIGSGFMLLCAARDFAVMQLGAPGNPEVRWLNLGVLIMLCTTAWSIGRGLLRRHLALQRLRQRTLQRLQRQTKRLQAAHEAAQQQQIQATTERERQRIMREIHDGVGSQLVHTLSYLGRTPRPDPSLLIQMLTQALDDLRINVDSAQDYDGHLASVLGALRRRIEPALRAQNITLHWLVDPDVPSLPQLNSPRAVLHVFRACQEIFANIVKHAHARNVYVSLQHQDRHLILAISDDGVGFDDRQVRGMGLNNIQARFARLQVSTSIVSTPKHGTTITAVFSIDQDFVESGLLH